MTGGLYTMWRPYIKQLSLLLGFMCQQIVVRRAAVVFANSGEGLDAGNAPFMYRCFSLLYRVLLRALEYLAIIPNPVSLQMDERRFESRMNCQPYELVERNSVRCSNL